MQVSQFLHVWRLNNRHIPFGGNLKNPSSFFLMSTVANEIRLEVLAEDIFEDLAKSFRDLDYSDECIIMEVARDLAKNQL